uniref:Uncharacterized protein n=1 Tax=Trichuris muris TaxID=70415 RepID=A0A5S6QMT3_TRIMR
MNRLRTVHRQRYGTSQPKSMGLCTSCVTMSYPVLPALEEEKAGWTPAYVGGHQMDSHRCTWEKDHVECPDRINETITDCSGRLPTAKRRSRITRML